MITRQQQFYERLPETLPVGTCTVPINGLICRAQSVLRLVGRGSGYEKYDGIYDDAPGKASSVWAHHIDWTTVPVQQEPKSSAASRNSVLDAVFETDEAWCARQLSEYTGQTVHCEWSSVHEIVVKLDDSNNLLRFSCSRQEARTRDASWFRARLSEHPGWPRAQNTEETLGNCLFCKSPPAAGYDCCTYCRQRIKESGTSWHNEPKNVAARVRLAAAERKARPRATAETRMLALPHPWECGGEDEP